MAARPEARLLAIAALAAVLSAACVHVELVGAGGSGATASSVPAGSSVPTSAVIWRSSLPEAFEEARASGRPVFLVAYRDDCSWCERLDDETLSAPAVVARLARFVCARVDPEASQSEAAYFKALGLAGYPTMYVLDASGALLGSIEGFTQAGELAERLEAFLGG